MCNYNEIVNLLMELDGRLDREMSKRYSGKIARAVHSLRQEQVKTEKTIIDLLDYEYACQGLSLNNIV